jgi:DNA-binding NarL/FixJ family response regulator
MALTGNLVKEDFRAMCTDAAQDAAGAPAQSPQSTIGVFSVDDHPALREGIAAIVNHQPGMKLIGGASNAREGIQMFRDLRPDVTLMDLRLPDLSGIEALIAIRSEFPEARILMLTTSYGDVEIQRSLRAGAAGYLLKNTPSKELVAAIRNVHQGKKSVPHEVAAHLVEHMSDDPLSPRETEVLRHMAGNRNKDIAQILFISEETVKVHVKHIMEKLGANNRAQAIAIAVRRGIIQF